MPRRAAVQMQLCITLDKKIYLEREQQQKGFDRVEATINEIPHEEVVCVGYIAADFEELLQVVELPMNVATNLAGTQGFRGSC